MLQFCHHLKEVIFENETFLFSIVSIPNLYSNLMCGIVRICTVWWAVVNTRLGCFISYLFVVVFFCLFSFFWLIYTIFEFVMRCWQWLWLHCCKFFHVFFILQIDASLYFCPVSIIFFSFLIKRMLICPKSMTKKNNLKQNDEKNERKNLRKWKWRKKRI